MKITGALAKQPLKAGQTIIAHGTHEDSSEIGAGIFLVLRQMGAREYMLAPLGSADEYWESYLSQMPTVKAVLWRDASETMPPEKELIVRWRIVSEVGEAPQNKDFRDFGKAVVEGLSRKWHFLNELVVSEKPPPQAGNDISGKPNKLIKSFLTFKYLWELMRKT